VGQDTKLTYGSIRNNLTYGLPWGEPNEGELEEAAQAANCVEFIQDMDEGYDSKVGEGGVRLSGGQKQRLAIARAFLRRPRLLILDEATSHLDAENEHLVQSAIDKLVQSAKEDGTARQNNGQGSCTVILIAHRLSTVRSADIIAVVNEGQVAEKGTHDQLIKRTDGIYAQLVAKQAERAANVLPEDGGAISAPRDANVDKLFDSVLGRREVSDSDSSSGDGSGSQDDGSSSDNSGSGDGDIDGESSEADSRSGSGSSRRRGVAKQRASGKDVPPSGSKTKRAMAEADKHIAALQARIAELEAAAALAKSGARRRQANDEASPDEAGSSTSSDNEDEATHEEQSRYGRRGASQRSKARKSGKARAKGKAKAKAKAQGAHGRASEDASD